jgi:hypothetical protein
MGRRLRRYGAGEDQGREHDSPHRMIVQASGW